MKKILFGFICVVGLIQVSCTRDETNTRRYRLSETIMIDGLERTYTIQLPGNYYNDTSERPVIFGLHGTGGSGAQFEVDYDFSSKTDHESVIAVYPDGIQRSTGPLKIRSWNAGECCDRAMQNNIDDVKFITTLIDELPSRFHINKKRIYLAGMSNGSMMAYRVAAEQPGKIAAIATVSGPMVYERNTSLQGVVPILHIHSTRDTKVPLHGGEGILDYYFPPVMEGLHYWAGRNGCDTAAIVQNFDGYELRSWENADGKMMVKCIITQDGGHSWPGSVKSRRLGDDPSKVVNANSQIWEFFKQFELP